MESSGVLPITQFAYRKGLGTCDARLCVSHELQSALESGQEAGIVQIDFSAALDRVNHQGILYKLCSVGIGGSVLSILTQYSGEFVLCSLYLILRAHKKTLFGTLSTMLARRFRVAMPCA